MGDKTEFPFLLPDINKWNWMDVLFCDDAIGLAAFYGEEENRLKL